ncbi:MAG: hypothetical protein EBZ95_10810 [Chitinophagia bacterium]|nr:hypothetical protein [Chitinophagia bacterium]
MNVNNITRVQFFIEIFLGVFELQIIAQGIFEFRVIQKFKNIKLLTCNLASVILKLHFLPI